MGKKRLGNDKPEYYPLRDAHGQVLGGIVICAWEEVIPPSYPTLEAFLRSKPSPAHLLEMSFKILDDFARPLPNVTHPPPPKPRKKRNTPDSESTTAVTEAKSVSGASSSTQTPSTPAPAATTPRMSQAEASTSSITPSQTHPPISSQASTSTQASSSKDPERDILH
ncbi:hypothetical protein AAF712_016075 [Marasmius tenuissimus]|uniref:Uncharacterized protein n=1 Tax=Marasmius tenuissimus TaxID=585030 RepID=A0ABR2Z7R6_9AGAR